MAGTLVQEFEPSRGDVEVKLAGIQPDKYKLHAPLINFYEHMEKKSTHRNPHESDLGFSHPMLVCIIGPSGAQTKGGGKTNAAINLIYQMRCFDEVYVFTQADEELYNYLSENAQNTKVRIFKHIDELPTLQELHLKMLKDAEPKFDEDGKRLPVHMKQRLFLFDDYIMEDRATKKRIQKYMLGVRKQNCSVIAIMQDAVSSSEGSGRQMRKQQTHQIIKGIMLEGELNTVLRDFVEPGIGLTLDVLKGMARQSQQPGHVFTVSLKDNHPDKRFRDGFSDCYRVSEWVNKKRKRMMGIEDEDENGDDSDTTAAGAASSSSGGAIQFKEDDDDDDSSDEEQQPKKKKYKSFEIRGAKNQKKHNRRKATSRKKRSGRGGKLASDSDSSDSD